jgi:transcriptional regulator with XRE-family HTH domain
MLVGMKRHEMPRSAASQAVIDLRTQLGESQQRFAERTLKSSIMTVSRYEGKFPPRGDALLRLAEVADKKNLPDLADTFRKLYLEDVYNTMGFSSASIVLPETQDKPARGCRIQKLEGVKELVFDHVCWHVLMSLGSKDKTEREAAEAAMDSLYDHAKGFGNQMVLQAGMSARLAAAAGRKSGGKK